MILLAQESEIAASLEYPASIIGALIGSRGAKINEDRGDGRLRMWRCPKSWG